MTHTEGGSEEMETPPPAAVQRDNGAHLDIWQAITAVDVKVTNLASDVTEVKDQMSPMQEIADNVKAIRRTFSLGFKTVLAVGAASAALTAVIVFLRTAGLL